MQQKREWEERKQAEAEADKGRTAQHTPGPWYEASTGNHQGLVCAEGSGANIAVTYDKRDAAKIAAAPELLELAQSIVSLAGFSAADQSVPKDERFAFAVLRDKARAAIAKATGEH